MAYTTEVVVEYMITRAIQKTFKTKSNYSIFLGSFIVSILLYLLAITQTGTIETFINETPFLVLVGQVVFSVLNSLLMAIVITMFIEVYREKKSQNNISFIQAFIALFFSVATTGCYVCGTVLLPLLGIAASFAALPLGGLEVKVITSFLLLYSLKDISKTVLGVCDLITNKEYRISFGQTSLKITGKFLLQLKPIAITVGFIVLIFALPVIIPNEWKKEVSASNVCTHQHSVESD